MIKAKIEHRPEEKKKKWVQKCGIKQKKMNLRAKLVAKSQEEKQKRCAIK